MKKQLKKIETAFTALRADVMISETDEKERAKRIVELGELEQQAINQLKETITELRDLLKIQKDYARMLQVKPKDAFLALIYRELRQVHWHLDQLIESKGLNDSGLG